MYNFIVYVHVDTSSASVKYMSSCILTKLMNLDFLSIAFIGKPNIQAFLSFNETLFQGLYNLQYLNLICYYDVAIVFTDDVLEHVHQLKWLMLYVPSMNVISFNIQTFAITSSEEPFIHISRYILSYQTHKTYIFTSNTGWFDGI